MLYLLDANVLMTAHALYYPIDRVPEFWAWLAHQCSSDAVKVPIEIFEEVKDGSTDEERDLLYGWIQDEAHRESIVLSGEVDSDLVAKVVSQGYATDLKDDEIEALGRDPFLIAHALMDAENRCVVTTEASKPTKTRQNRRIPDVCAAFGVKCCDPFTMFRTLGFSTGWSRKA